MVVPSKSPTLAYSYVRFSNPDQINGHSLQRQLELTQAYCRRHNLILDQSLCLRDLGVSAWTGANAKQGQLRGFLQAVEEGKVPAGSVLIVEKIDRISRQGIDEGWELLKTLLKAGVRIVTLAPEREYGEESVKGLMKGALELLLLLELAHQESLNKSERVGRAWRAKKLRASGGIITARAPGWLRLDPAARKLVPIPEAVQTVQFIFQLASSGYGATVITKRLNAEKIPVIGRRPYWIKSSVWRLLRNRAVLGEYQPHKGRGSKKKKDGDPIPNYYPRIVEDSVWWAAQGSLDSRRGKGGRTAKETVNLFSHLLVDARDRSPMHRRKHGGGRISFVSSLAIQGVADSRFVSFPAAVFESAFLLCLRELDPQEVLPSSQGGRDAAVILTGRLTAVGAEIEKLKDRLESRFTDAVADVLERKEAEKRSLEGQLAEVRKEAAAPVETAWKDCKGLIGILTEAKGTEEENEVRTRLQAALRRILSEVWCLFVSRGRERIAVVQAFFVGADRRRDYYISWKPPLGTKTWNKASSLVIASTAGLSDRGLYLKDRSQIEALSDSLEEHGLTIRAEQYPEALQWVLDHGGSFVDADHGLQVWCVKGTRTTDPTPGKL
jgi:DNA invertase Pin-like site-specific DNA recombinase